MESVSIASALALIEEERIRHERALRALEDQMAALQAQLAHERERHSAALVALSEPPLHPAAAAAAAAGAVVCLDVSGRTFKFHRDVLAGHAGSFFGALLNGNWRADGPVFVDRDPVAFEWVARYLRDHTLDCTALSQCDKQLLLREAEFFLLEPLQRLLEAAMVAEHHWVWEVSSTVTSSKRARDNVCCDRGKCGWSQGVHEWIVRLDTAMVQ